MELAGLSLTEALAVFGAFGAATVVLYLLNSALYAASVGGAGRDRIASEGPGSAVFMARAHAELYDELLNRL